MPPKRGGGRRVRSKKRTMRGRTTGRRYGIAGVGVRKRLGRKYTRTRRTGGVRRSRRFKRTKGKTRSMSFRKRLAVETGRQWDTRKQYASQFQVPLTAVEYADIKETAQYMWPRQPSANYATGNHDYPFNQTDVKALIAEAYPLLQWDTITPYIYMNEFYTGYEAKYQVRNQTNTTVRYEAIKMKCKKHIYGTGEEHQHDVPIFWNWNNLFNIAGRYLSCIDDPSIADNGDANNLSLQDAAIDITKLPPIKLYFSSKKKRFTLGPGQVKTFTIRVKKDTLRLLEMFSANKGLASTNFPPFPMQVWRKGTQHMIFRMFSDPADSTSDGQTDPKLSLSTRTNPLSILTYQVTYHSSAPATAKSKQVYKLAPQGYDTSIVAANVNIMRDDDFKEGGILVAE